MSALTIFYHYDSKYKQCYDEQHHNDPYYEEHLVLDDPELCMHIEKVTCEL